jgi:hypothetical protein
MFDLIQVKNEWKTDEKWDVISWIEKCARIIGMWHNVMFAYSSVCTIRDNADRITESAKSGTKVLCSCSTTVLLEWTVPGTMDVGPLYFYCCRYK